MTEKVDTGKTVLAFGSQALSTNREVLRSIQATISSTKELDWAKDVLQQLPTNLKDLGNDLPNLAQAQAIYHLQILSNWFGADASTDLDSFETLPNVIQTPLCVLHQLASYYNNVKQNNQTFHSLVDTEAVGFCTGLLAAAAVSLSSTPEELVHHASSSLRLAMIIGAAVDAQDAKQGKHVSFSTAWKASSGMDTVKEIVKNHKDVSLTKGMPHQYELNIIVVHLGLLRQTQGNSYDADWRNGRHHDRAQQRRSCDHRNWSLREIP